LIAKYTGHITLFQPVSFFYSHNIIFLHIKVLPIASSSGTALLETSLTSSSNNNNNNNPPVSPSQHPETTPVMSPSQSPLQSPHASPPSSPSRRRRASSIKELPSTDDTESEQEESDIESKDKDLEEEFEEVNQSFEGGEAEQEDQKIQRLLEPGDVLQNVYNCGRVQGMDRIACLFLVCASNIYVIDNYAINPLGDIVEVNSASEKKNRPYAEQEVKKWYLPCVTFNNR
jgi:DNA mismatch repair ATPase MutL